MAMKKYIWRSGDSIAMDKSENGYPTLYTLLKDPEVVRHIWPGADRHLDTQGFKLFLGF